MTDFAKDIEAFQKTYQAVVEQIRRVIVARDEILDEVLACLLSGSHALLEGVPGIGKTQLVRTLSAALNLSFSRVQFTPDLMPADITGTDILQLSPDGGKAFAFAPGPIFANVVLADEINRATPKTQSALLEAMQERTVSVARNTHALPSPFVVLATQNPIEMEGTYPLPEAQLDRFALKIVLASPSREELSEILARTTGAEEPVVQAVASAEDIDAMKAVVRRLPVASHVRNYVAALVAATHPDHPAATPMVKSYVRYGASPRGGQAILLAAKVAACRDGRSNVANDDVRATVPPALRHRLILNFDAQADGVNVEDILAQLLEHTPVPAS
ncbi:MAG: MoxR family ATPase [Phycisphaerae bacterium]|nr:MoxR family ATPase [Phycisphaerae bacterium]